MIDKGRISAIRDNTAVVIPSFTKDAVTCPLTIPPRLQGLLEIDMRVVYVLFDDNSGEIIEILDSYQNPEPGGDDKSYIHIQSTAAEEWNISHNLDKYPAVTVVDSAGTTVMGECEYIDKNTVKLSFSAAFSGKAYLN